MRNQISPRRRLAAVCGGCAAAIAGSSSLLLSSHRSNLVGALEGFAVGLAVTVSIGTFLMSGRRGGCEPSE